MLQEALPISDMARRIPNLCTYYYFFAQKVSGTSELRHLICNAS